MFLLPGDRDREGKALFPWATLLLAAVCVAFSLYAQRLSELQIEDHSTRLQDLSEGVYSTLQRDHNQLLSDLREIATKVATGKELEVDQKLRDLQAKFKRNWLEPFLAEKAKFLEGSIYRSLGYTPGNTPALATAPFTHGRVLHLALAVAFLLLFGAKVEALWGRGVLVGVFVGGGALGAWIQHAAGVSPEEIGGLARPILGAFPAVSALLGVILGYAVSGGLRHAFDDALNFVSLRFQGKEPEATPFGVPVLLVGIFWVFGALFLFHAAGLDQGPGHGGCDIGPCVAVLGAGAVVSGAARRLVLGSAGAPAEAAAAASEGALSVAAGSYKQHPSYLTAVQQRRDGQLDPAIQLFRTLSDLYADQPGPLLDCYELYVLQRDRANAVEMIRRACTLGFRGQDEELGLRCYRQLMKDFPGEVLLADDQLKVAIVLEKKGQFNEAMMANKGVYDHYPDEPVAAKAYWKHAEICLHRMNTPPLAIAIARKGKQKQNLDPFWKDNLDRLISEATAALEGSSDGKEAPGP